MAKNKNLVEGTKIIELININCGHKFQIKELKDVLLLLKILRDDSLKGDGTGLFIKKEHRIYEHFPFGLWFRGESDHIEPLVPSAFRKQNGGKYLKESGIMWDVGRKIVECAEIENHFERLCMAQHYLVPTRLLDWTENILIALFFAVSGEEKSDKKLFVLNSFSLNQATGWNEGKYSIYDNTDYGTIFRALMAFSVSSEHWKDKIRRVHPEWDWKIHDKFKEKEKEKESHSIASYFTSPIATAAVWRHDRMKAQSSVFTLHGGSFSWKEQETVYPEPIKQCYGNIITYLDFTIPEYCVKQIKDDLLLLGIHEGTVFPEVDKQRKYFESIWMYKG